jgi:phosphoesterase RecJ-like protein
MNLQNLNIKSHDLKKISEISKIIYQSKTFFIAGHIGPDADSIGSMLAFSSVLDRMNKKNYIYCYNKIPKNLYFFKKIEKIKTFVNKEDIFDCAIILESSNFLRVGDVSFKNKFKKIINIDHHFNNSNFGDINYVVKSSSSVSELVLNVFEFMKIKLTKNEAENLYIGILTDTGCFQYSNTNINSHISSIKLMKYGINVNKIYQKAYGNKTLCDIRLKGLALCNIKTVFNNRISYIVLTKENLKKGKTYIDYIDVVNCILLIKHVKIACVFKEINDTITKISCRSIRNFNLLNVVNKFGGGGHKNAAGCIIQKDIYTSVKIIIDMFKKFLN